MRGRGNAEDIFDFVRLGDLAGIGGGGIDGGGKGGCLAGREMDRNLRAISQTISYNKPMLISILLFAVSLRSSVFSTAKLTRYLDPEADMHVPRTRGLLEVNIQPFAKLLGNRNRKEAVAESGDSDSNRKRLCYRAYLATGGIACLF